MKQIFMAYIYINDKAPTKMIVSGKNRKSVRRKLTDFFMKINPNNTDNIIIRLDEIYYDGKNYFDKNGDLI